MLNPVTGTQICQMISIIRAGELMARPAYGGRAHLRSPASRSTCAAGIARDGCVRANIFSCSWTCGGEPSGNISVRTEGDAVVLMYRSRSWEAPSGNPSSSACPSLGRPVTSAAVGPGSSAPSIPVGDTAGVESRCCTAPANYSRAGAATAWPMRANKNRCTTAGLERHRKSEWHWEGARICSTISRISRTACTGGPMSVCAVHTILLKRVLRWG